MGRERVVAGWLSAIEATGRGTGPPSTAIPGIDPWDEVLRNPRIWHFVMHSIPARPERLVQGRQREFFDFFYDVLSPDPTRITAPARAAYAQFYAQDSAALSAGFNWYRTLAQDAIDNQEASPQAAVTTPVLYVRGAKGRGQIDEHLEGFRSSRLVDVDHALLSGAGHFSPEEEPEQVWRLIGAFARL
jgi:pimeloyl-ACP methyl ester carboxylesterase